MSDPIDPEELPPDDALFNGPVFHPLVRLALGVTRDVARRHSQRHAYHVALAQSLRTTPAALRALDNDALSRLPVDELMARLGATPRGGA